MSSRRGKFRWEEILSSPPIFAFEGDLYSFFSYWFLAGAGLSIRSDKSYPYYGFTRQDDAYPINWGGNGHVGTASFSGETLSIMFQVGAQAAVSFGDG